MPALTMIVTSKHEGKGSMSDRLEPLIRDLVAWCAREPRSYEDTIEAWRTSCPRLTVWEDAVERGLVRSERRPEGSIMVSVTPAGHAYLQQSLASA